MLMALAGGAGAGGWIFYALALLAALPVSEAAVALVNLAVTSSFDPATLPSLALTDGVPANLRTMIVVPTLLTTRAAIAAQVERLEVHHLANSDGDLIFALLSDWTDSASRGPRRATQPCCRRPPWSASPS